MTQMRFIHDLSPETVSLLNRIYRYSQSHPTRQRAHCILLSFQGFTMDQLTLIYGVTYMTIYNWFTAWEDRKFAGLYDRPGRGRKPIFSPDQKEQIRQWAKQYPKNLNKIRSMIKETWGKTVSKDTIKRILKSFSMSWHRLRRGLGGQPDPEEYEMKYKALEEMKERDRKGEIDLRYLDEAGFSLIACVPYGWQERGATITVPSRQSRRLNVIGLMNRNNELDVYEFTGRVTSEVIIMCLDKFSERIQKPTIVVLDQAKIHTSEAIQEKIEEWEKKGLELFWLPTYSPQLNLIEILWRFIKYEWIEVEAYTDWSSLVEYVEKVLRGFGTEYKINFT